jgi:PII-like signaling protein
VKLEGTGTLLRIFVGESDQWQGKPLFESIVLAARKHGLAGATVLRGPMGFGASSIIHSAKIVRLSSDLPIVVEIVDTEAKIHDFLPILDEMVTEGMITLETVQVLRYRGRERR